MPTLKISDRLVFKRNSETPLLQGNVMIAGTHPG